MKRRIILPGTLAACLLAALLGAGSAVAATPPEWKVTVTPNANWFLPGQYGVYKIEAENVGESPTENSKPIKLENRPPAGLSGEQVAFYDCKAPSEGIGCSSYGGFGEPGAGPEDACISALVCKWPEGSEKATLPAIQPGQRLIMVTIFAVAPGTEGTLEDVARVSGGGATTVTASATNAASSSPAFGALAFSSSLADSSGLPYAQAGGHPNEFTTEYEFASYSQALPFAGSGGASPSEYARAGTVPLFDPSKILAELPPGLIADPQALPTCSLADFFAESCAPKAVVGILSLRLLGSTESAFKVGEPIYNLQPNGAAPGELGATVAGAPFIVVSAGPRSGGDYGLTATNVAQQAALTRVRFELWGVPAEHSHDSVRTYQCAYSAVKEDFLETAAALEPYCKPGEPPVQAGTPEAPFIAMPTQCSGGGLEVRGAYDSWQQPAEFARRSVDLQSLSGCNQLHFEPSIEAHPTTNRADSPSGLAFDLRVPQDCWEALESPSFEALCQSDLSEAVVKLPAGLAVNPASGNGLAACLPAQVGLETPVGQTPAHFAEVPARCPEASAIGTAEVHTPLLHNTLKGVVFLATPRQNPFSSFLAAYIVLEGEGLIVKLPGRIEADPQTGQLTGRFLENPQLPFQDFHLEFFGGARGDLRTPATCGSYETTAALTPYSHTEPTEGGGTVEATPIATPKASFETTAAPREGEACPTAGSSAPNSPTFRAGTESPQAGAFTPFSFRLAREDGSQEIAKIETTLPPGLVGKLAGVGECSEAQLAVAQGREHEGGGEEEKASPSCPSSSELGIVEVASGAGPTPLYVQGKAYLAGPYKGAPLSIAIITPAVAGPFDLGTVVVRTALYVNPETAQIKAVSDPIPHILQGIPLDVRSVTLKMDRPNFTLNPTNCNEMAFSGSATSVLENVAPLAQRFQVGGCSVLPFNPKLSISLKGSTKRTGHPALKAVLTMKPGQANIAKAQVTLPHSEFLDQGHIGTVCTRVQFAEGSVPGERCPPGSIYGHAKAVTPLLDAPVEGPVYLRSSNHKLPDLVAALNGQISVALDGIVDTGKTGGIRNTFEVVPDAPVSKFVLTMKGGRKGLLVNSESLCGKKPHRAEADFSAQNGKVSDTEPVVKAKCPVRHERNKGKKHKHRAKRHL